jgi:hypothetical protein
MKQLPFYQKDRPISNEKKNKKKQKMNKKE